MPRDTLVPLLFAACLAACGSDSSGPASPTRSYRMGFSALPPRPDTAILLPTLTLTTEHSDAGLVQLSIPWTVLLGRIPAAEEVRVVRLPLPNYYRGVGQPITVAAFQITFTDLDLSAAPPPAGSVLPLFAHLGLVDSVLSPKPALAVWDSVLALDLQP